MTGAACTSCGAPAQPGAWRCECGGIFDLPERPAFPLPVGPGSVGEGLWRYAPWVPVPCPAGLSMGEGATPLLDAGAGLRVKLEFVSPTASFKDRGAVVLMASALERGAERVVADSSGNAGSAIAAYSARAGLECTVFVPEGTSPRKRAQIEAYGARLERVPGDRTETTQRAIEEVSRSGAMYASHIYDPWFIQGTKTFAFEVWEQLGRVPDAVLVPVGNGTLLLGAARGFRELQAGGLTDRVPVLIGLQSERCPPLADAWARDLDRPAEIDAAPTAAEGIAIPRPPRGVQILAEIRKTGGAVVSVPEAAIAPAQREAARRGMLIEPTAALVWGAALLLRDQLPGVSVQGEPWRAARAVAGGLAGATVVVPLCGSGLKGD